MKNPISKLLQSTGIGKVAGATKKVACNIKAIVTVIVRMFVKALKAIWRVIKLLCKCIAHIELTLIIISIMVAVYGIALIIIEDEIEFVVDDGTGSSNEQQDDIDASNMTDEERYYAMALALDRDKIAKDYNLDPAMQEFYNKIRLTNYSGENPAKMIDIFALACEIYARPEINGDRFENKLSKNLLFGTWSLESSLDMGSGDRLLTSEINFYQNDDGYCNPFGCPASKWIDNVDINSNLSMGATYICQQENPDIPSEQRAILGGAGNIKALSTQYITEDAVTRREDGVLIKAEDEAIKYLNGIVLENTRCKQRGFLTWLPDSFYEFAYSTRIFSMGLHRDTHNGGYWGGTPNREAFEQIVAEVGLTNEEQGDIWGMLYCGDRHQNSKAEAWPNNTSEQISADTDYKGMTASFILVARCEGALDEAIEDIGLNYGYFKNNFGVTPYLFGEVDPDNRTDIQLSDTAYYKVYQQKLNSNDATLKKTYPDYIKDAYNVLEEYYPKIHILYNSNAEGLIRLQYSMQTYIVGGVINNVLENIIDSYYNYTDSSGNYIYRLYDVEFDKGAVTTDGSTIVKSAQEVMEAYCNGEENDSYEFGSTELYTYEVDGTPLDSYHTTSGYVFAVLKNAGYMQSVSTPWSIVNFHTGEITGFDKMVIGNDTKPMPGDIIVKYNSSNPEEQRCVIVASTDGGKVKGYSVLKEGLKKLYGNSVDPVPITGDYSDYDYCFRIVPVYDTNATGTADSQLVPGLTSPIYKGSDGKYYGYDKVPAVDYSGYSGSLKGFTIVPVCYYDGKVKNTDDVFEFTATPATVSREWEPSHKGVDYRSGLDIGASNAVTEEGHTIYNCQKWHALTGNTYHPCISAGAQSNKVCMYCTRGPNVVAQLGGVVTAMSVAGDNTTVTGSNFGTNSCGVCVNVTSKIGSDTYVTRYMHLAPESINPAITIGYTLKPGEFIGVMGNTGESYGMHLHADTCKNGSTYLFTKDLFKPAS